MSGRLVPVDFFDWGFFDRQKSLFPKFKDDFGSDFADFDRELEKMRKEMFQLTPMDFGGMGASDFGKTKSEFTSLSTKMKSDFDSFGKDPFGDMGMDMGSSSLLKVDKPFVEEIGGNKKLSLHFDCAQFKPEEIQVKTVDRSLTVHAKHTEESPGKKVYREFTKQYTLPESIDPLKVTSSLSKDGVLSVEAPAPKSVEVRRERLIPIEKLRF